MFRQNLKNSCQTAGLPALVFFAIFSKLTIQFSPLQRQDLFMAFFNSVLKELHFKAVYAGPPRSGKRSSLQRIAARGFPEKTFFTFLDSICENSPPLAEAAPDALTGTGAETRTAAPAFPSDRTITDRIAADRISETRPVAGRIAPDRSARSGKESGRKGSPAGGQEAAPAKGRAVRIPLLIVNIGTVLGHKTFFHALSLPSACDDEAKQVLLQGADGIVFVADSRPEAEADNKKALAFLENSLQKPDLFKIPLAFQYNKRDLEPKIPLEVLRAGLNKYNSKDFESSVTAPPLRGPPSDTLASGRPALEKLSPGKPPLGGPNPGGPHRGKPPLGDAPRNPPPPDEPPPAGPAVSVEAASAGNGFSEETKPGGRGRAFASATAPFKHICRLILAEIKSIDLP